MFTASFWTAVAFVAFVALVYKPVSRIITNGLDNRSKQISDDLDEALRLKEEAQELLASYKRKQKEAKEEADRIVRFAEDEVKRIKEEAEQDLEEALNKRIEVSMQKIASYEASVLQEVRTHAIDISVSAVRALIMENFNNDVAEDMLQKAVADMQRKLH